MQTVTGGRYRRVADASFTLGAAVIIFIAAILLISSLLFIAGRPLSPSSFWPALAATVPAVWFMCNHYFSAPSTRSNAATDAPARLSVQGAAPDSPAWKRWDRRRLAMAGILIFLAAVFLLSIHISGRLYDLSYDGQIYHQEAIIQLAGGWNPFHDRPLPIATGIWINHYAKGPWITAASLYALTGHIEQGKFCNLLLIVASFFLCLSALSIHYQRWAPEPLLFAALAAGNPIAVLQSSTFYIDGQLSSMLVIIPSLLFLIIKSPDLCSALLLLLSVIIAVNIKFTALAYLLALCLPVLLYLLIARKNQLFKLITTSLGAGLIAGMLLVGFNPYVTNTTGNGNPFYPLAGHRAVDITTANSPAGFPGMNRLKKLFIATFSRTEAASGPSPVHWKWPLTVSKEELQAIQPDSRIAGFGPLFGGAILLSLALLAAMWPLNKKMGLAYAGLGLLLTGSALVNPEAWWARYAPQIWLLPVLFAMPGLAANHKPQRILGLAIILALCLNLYMVSAAYFDRQIKDDRIIENQLAEMRKASLVLVCFQTHYSNRVRLTEAGIHYREVARLDGPGVQTLNHSDTTYKLYPHG